MTTAHDTVRILLAEDNPGDALLIRTYLCDEHPDAFTLETVPTLTEALAYLDGHTVEVVLLDLGLPDSTGLDTFRKLFPHAYDMPVIVLSGLDDADLAAQAVREGAQDYLLKGTVNGGMLARTIRYAIGRKAAEQTAAESIRFAYATLNALSAQIAILEKNGTILAVNRAWSAFAQATGRSLPCLPPLGMGVDFLAACEGVTGAPSGSAHVLAGGIRDVLAGRSEEFMMDAPLHLPAEEYWFTYRVRRFPAPRPLRVVLSCEDITRRVHAEAQHHQLAVAVAQAADCILITDVQGVIEYVNPAFEQVYGYSAESVIGQPTALLKSGHQDDAFYAAFWEHILGGEVWQGTMINKCKDGTLCHLESTVSPVRGQGGNIVRFIATQRDITHQRGIEEQLRQTQKMEAIGLLAGGVAHDFNNLLTAIQGYTELLMMDLVEDPGAMHSLQQIESAASSAGALTRQLLAFARKQKIAPEVLDLNVLVENMLKMLRRLIGEHIELKVHLSPMPAHVLADPAQLDQILMNLAINARDAMPGGGQMRIEIACCAVDQASADAQLGQSVGEYVQLSMTDTGCGMSRDTITRIFEPFFTTKPEGEGTGLGLPTVYGVVKQAGGDIFVESEVDKGSTFRVRLPRVGAPALAEHRAVERPSAQEGDAGILLVEDNEPLLKLTAHLLRAAGYRVFEAMHPREAIELFAEHASQIDLLFTDVVMPETSGPQLAEELLARKPGLKTLFMSGYTNHLMLEQGMIEDGAPYIQKPFGHALVLRKVREVLDGAE